MKHPRYEVLQDYFENVLNAYQEGLVKEHLLNCDECTKVLSHFAVIETKLKNDKPQAVSAVLKNKIFADAKKMLAVKKEKVEVKEATAKERAQKLEELKQYYQNWKETVFPEIKVPALQLCSLSLVLMVFVSIERNEGVEVEVYEPLTSEVNVFTYQDVPQKVEK